MRDVPSWRTLLDLAAMCPPSIALSSVAVVGSAFPGAGLGMGDDKAAREDSGVGEGESAREDRVRVGEAESAWEGVEIGTNGIGGGFWRLALTAARENDLCKSKPSR